MKIILGLAIVLIEIIRGLLYIFGATCQLIDIIFRSEVLKWFGHLFRRKTKPLIKLSQNKIEPYVLTETVSEFDSTLVFEICKEVVRDQVGRNIEDGETIKLIDSYQMVDGSTLVMFMYRKHEQINVNGVSKDKIAASIHSIRLTLNIHGCFVEIEAVQSMDARSLQGVQTTDFLQEVMSGCYKRQGTKNSLDLPTSSLEKQPVNA